MTGWVDAISGTPEGHVVAMGLALLAAVSHAVFGALQKGRHDPWLSRGAIDISYGLMALPVALFVVPWPQGEAWAILAGAEVIHLGYKLAQASAYSRGDFTVVYPIVRGTGPLVTVAAAGLLFGERYSGVQWGGVMLLSGAIFALALVNLARPGRDRAPPVGTLGWALLTGVFVAAYTTYDAFGIRATPDPFTFLAWFFMIDGLVFPWIALWRYRRMLAPPEPLPLMLRGVTGGLVAFVSFGGVMLATRIDRVGQAAVLRETSVVFAALIGWAFLGERVGMRRASLAVLIALGAVVVEFG
ncbi:MAG TPA: DMT family transporter [Amaricoccus sp.]|uniref:DMT family transporter n=1 Tax=Amaricoccus sp. TaxID=1872485 RepID=UPI002BBCEB83|nr:DMT family transporter [Amaricoccus sp.]HMQ95230.1 DMT family transporter [Amaricoccus sp.]HMR53322.1 DMT family transporter [Amaricoccus sp.]HMR62268.1 DMT family transporter [Amaricoccus sp.]HMU00215.1 DMT family transporter [Amaricoccus sp.]